MIREIITRDDKFGKSSILIGPGFVAFQDRWVGDPAERMAIAEMEMMEAMMCGPDEDEQELIRESEISLMMAEPGWHEPMCPFEIDNTHFESDCNGRPRKES